MSEDVGFDPVEARESQVMRFEDGRRRMGLRKDSVLSNSMSKLKEDGSEKEDKGFDPVEARQSQVMKFNSLQKEMDRRKQPALSSSLDRLDETPFSLAAPAVPASRPPQSPHRPRSPSKVLPPPSSSVPAGFVFPRGTFGSGKGKSAISP